MEQDQKFTPKYWIAHSVCRDDVYLGTAAKSWSECQENVERIFGDLGDSVLDNLLISLCEIRLVQEEGT